MTNYSGSGKYHFSLDDTVTVPIIPAELISLDASVLSSSEINVTFSTNGSGENVVIVWNNSGSFSTPSGTPPSIGSPFVGGIMLYNGITSPQLHSGLMPVTNYFYKAFSYNGTNYSSGLTDNATTQSGSTFSLSISVTNGWNMVSVPGINPAGQGVSTWWPDRNLLADVYKWNGTYSVVTNTTPGEGYWMLHTGAQTYNYPAIQVVNHDPIPLTTGWKMIGGMKTLRQ